MFLSYFCIKLIAISYHFWKKSSGKSKAPDFFRNLELRIP